VRERLAVSKQTAQKIYTEWLNLKKLNEWDVNSIRLQPETSLLLWKTYRTMGTSTGHRSILDRTSKFRPKRV
jgi:hypothetical protein